MKKLIIDKIDSLAPLPQSVFEIEEFKKRADKEPLDLLKIIEKDPIVVATLLKVSNSAMFGFRNKIETPSRAINLLGINFAISIALGTIIKNSINLGLKAYSVTTDEFLYIANLGSSILNNWIGHFDFNLKEELLLPAFLQEMGKFIISELICEYDKTAEFKEALDSNRCLDEIEKEFAKVSCAQITANIFKHWNLSHNLIFTIGFVGNIDKCPIKFITRVKILEIIKILCDIREPLGELQVQRAMLKASEYGVYPEKLKNAIDTVKKRVNNAEE